MKGYEREEQVSALQVWVGDDQGLSPLSSPRRLEEAGRRLRPWCSSSTNTGRTRSLAGSPTPRPRRASAKVAAPGSLVPGSEVRAGWFGRGACGKAFKRAWKLLSHEVVHTAAPSTPLDCKVHGDERLALCCLRQALYAGRATCRRERWAGLGGGDRSGWPGRGGA